jgi:hypothetical protein
LVDLLFPYFFNDIILEFDQNEASAKFMEEFPPIAIDVKIAIGKNGVTPIND